MKAAASGNLVIDGDRLWSTIMASADIGKGPRGGLRRLTLTDDDKRMRDVFAGWAKDSGYGLPVDKLGSMFVRREGLDPSLPPVLIGSHLDTQASGGRFDYRPEEFGLGVDAREMFAALAVLFDALATVPTTSELRKLLADALANARTEEHLRHCIFGWMEHVDRARLFSPTLTPLVHEAVMAINRFQGMDHIEIGSPL